MFHSRHKTLFCVASVVLLLCTLQRNGKKWEIYEVETAAQGTITSGSKCHELPMLASSARNCRSVSVGDRSRITSGVQEKSGHFSAQNHTSRLQRG